MPHSMQRHPSRLIPWAFVAVAVAVSCGRGTSAAEPGEPPRLREAEPEIYYMEDDAGRLVPVPGFRYHDFVELLRLREGLPGAPEPPAAVLESLVVRAELPAPRQDAAQDADGPARCRATVELTVRQSRGGWAEIPLDLDGLLLTAPPRYEGGGRMLLSAAGGETGETPSTRGGYRLWVTATTGRGEPDVNHAVVLSGELPIDATSTFDTLAVRLPRATATLVEITTPRLAPDVAVSPVAVPARVEPRADDEGSVVTVPGLVGNARIRVGRPPEMAAAVSRRASVPQVTVESLVRIDGRVAITEATLSLEDLPADAGTIRVSLPPRTTLRSVASPATLVAVEGAAAAPTAVIRLEVAADRRGRVELECERPVDPAGREAFEPLGFAVKDVPPWRQRGRVSLLVDGDWQLEWNDAVGQRRIDPPLSARRPGFVAAFAWDSQPAHLPLRVRARGSRVVIEPEYRYEVATTRIGLDARLRVSARGAPVSRITVPLDDWQVDDVGPAGLVDSAAVSTDGGRLVIPFLQPLAGDAVVEIRGGRPLAADADRVAWKIPVPQADLVGPATVLITSRSDIELSPDEAGVRGLVRQIAPSTPRPDGDRPALAYRLDGAEGRFEAARRFLPRRVDAGVVARVDVDRSAMVVRETVRLDVAHVPLEFITLSVPEAILRGGALEVRQNGLLLNPEEDHAAAVGSDASQAPVPDAVPPTPDAPRLRVRAMLAAPLLGAGEVTVQYELPTPQVPPTATAAEDLPVVLPADARIDRQTITVAAADTLSIDVRGTAWKLDVGSLGAVASRTWTTSRAQESVPLAIATRKRSPLGDATVDAAWLQTRLVGRRREEVYRYCVHGAAERITVVIPPSLTSNEAGATFEVRLDGRTVPAAVNADGRIVVDLPQPNGRAAWLLELLATRKLETVAGLPAAVDLAPPVFPAGTVQRRFYWEVVNDPDDHLLGQPRGWTSQQRWEWGSFGLRPVAAVSRGALQDWLRASLVSAAPPAGDGLSGEARAALPSFADAAMPIAGQRSVYTGAGPPEQGRLWLVPTWLVVLAVSGPVLAIGLLVVYSPALRTVPVLLAAATLASLAAAAAPGTAPLVFQAAAPGLALVGLAAVLRHVLRPTPSPDRQTVVPAVSASSLTQVAAPSLIIRASSPGLDATAAAAGEAT